ncbi:MAG: thiamine biosynthesis protein ThiS [Candidatus Solibacter sp.]|nr:thiamine biosynthesis protein ThiS [Candidatus Solibacter sp.]
MKITVNGSPQDAPQGLRLPALLELIGIDSARVAIELNRRIVRKSDWPSTTIQDGDSIEVVTFVGGG